MGKKHCTAIVLAAGQGKRMGTSVQKQYIELDRHPLIYYTLQTFEDSRVIDDIVLVVGPGQEDYVYQEIVRKYYFTKIKAIVPGGKERYDSVYVGLKNCEDCDYVFIHDGARPFVEEEILQQALQTVQTCGACVAAVPSKDTVKIVNEEGLIVDTPDRSKVWIVQTPQVFEYALIRRAYDKLMNGPHAQVTDDAMAVELMENHPVKVTKGSYYNIKITTPEDMMLAKAYVQARSLS